MEKSNMSLLENVLSRIKVLKNVKGSTIKQIAKYMEKNPNIVAKFVGTVMSKLK